MKTMTKLGLISSLVMLISTTSCGFSTGPGGWVVGSTGFLAEQNRALGIEQSGPMDAYLPTERRALQAELDKQPRRY